MVNSVPQGQTTDMFLNANKVISRNKLIFETPIFIQTLNRFSKLIEPETHYPTKNDQKLDVTCADCRYISSKDKIFPVTH
jgi:hypothetical protein